jgi:hypothetical protein
MNVDFWAYNWGCSKTLSEHSIALSSCQGISESVNNEITKHVIHGEMTSQTSSLRPKLHPPQPITAIFGAFIYLLWAKKWQFGRIWQRFENAMMLYKLAVDNTKPVLYSLSQFPLTLTNLAFVRG